MSVRLLALTLLIAATAGAQDRAANTISAETSDPMTAEEGSGAIAVVPLVPLPETPAPHRVIDKKFIFVMAALGGAESMRFTSRKLVLDHEFAAWRSLVHTRSSESAPGGQVCRTLRGRIAGRLRNEEAPLLASRRQDHPKILVGVSRGHGNNPLQERRGEHSNARARRLHNGGVRDANTVAGVCECRGRV
jgi:hypothetical protein